MTSPPQSEMQEKRTRRTIVLDTGALIAGTDSLYALGGLVDPNLGTSPQSPLEACDVRFYVTPDVVSEVRDARARARLAALDQLGVIEQRAPSAEAVAYVANFAKETGDYSVLSVTDMHVLSLCWMLEVERNGTKYLNEKPVGGAVTEIRKARGIRFEDVDRMEREEEEVRALKRQDDDGWTAVGKLKVDQAESVVPSEPPKAKSKKRNRKRKPRRKPRDEVGARDGEGLSEQELETSTNGCTERGAAIDPEDTGAGYNSNGLCEADVEYRLAHLTVGLHEKEDVSSCHVDDEGLLDEQNSLSHDPNLIRDLNNRGAGEVTSTVEDSAALADLDEDDDDGWINEDNLEEHLARDRGAEAMSDEDLNRVACVTTDFAMQNTMLQMGLKLLSVDGRRSIRQVKHFALRCQSCAEVTRELQRKFCEKCGNATLHRVAFKINKKGVARAFINPKKKPSLRGTKYPIPLPRGGRHNNDLILCEDQIDPVKQRRLQKQRERLNVDVLDPSNFYNAGARFNPHNRPLVVGYGRRNPNEVRASSKSSKKR